MPRQSFYTRVKRIMFSTGLSVRPYITNHVNIYILQTNESIIITPFY